MKRLILALLMISLILTGCSNNKATIYDQYSKEEKVEMYEDYFKRLPDLITDSSYYMIEVYHAKENEGYEIYNFETKKQIHFISEASEEDTTLEYDAENAYLRIGMDTEVKYVTAINDEISQIISSYDIDLKECITTISNVSIEETEKSAVEKYFLDEVSFDIIINDQTYHGMVEYYIDKDKNVKYHNSLDILLDGTFNNAQGEQVSILIYQASSPVDQSDFTFETVSQETFIQYFNDVIKVNN